MKVYKIFPARRLLKKKNFTIIMLIISLVINVIFFILFHKKTLIFVACSKCKNLFNSPKITDFDEISPRVKNAKVSIVWGDYVLPAEIIAGKENFGKPLNKIIFNEKQLQINNSCKYSKFGPRILCSVFIANEKRSKAKYILNTWGRR